MAGIRTHEICLQSQELYLLDPLLHFDKKLLLLQVVFEISVGTGYYQNS